MTRTLRTGYPMSQTSTGTLEKELAFLWGAACGDTNRAPPVLTAENATHV
jgi:hypothetical protein